MSVLRAFLSVMAVNHLPALSDEPGEWKLLCPWGEHPNDVGLQHVTPETMAPLLTAINARGERWKGIPIYAWHPFHHLAKKMGWTDKRERGRVTKFEARTKGLFGFLQLNDLGRATLAAGELVMPSLGWDLGPRDARDRRAPTRLDHLGLVSRPNVKGVPDLRMAINAELSNSNANQTNTDDMKKTDELNAFLAGLRGKLKLADDGTNEAINSALEIKIEECNEADDTVRILREKLYLPADATLEQVQAAIETRMAEHAAWQARSAECEAEIAALKQQLADEQARATSAVNAATEAEGAINAAQAERTALIAERDEHRDARTTAETQVSAINAQLIETTLDLATAQTRITPAQRDEWKAKLQKDLVAGVTAINAEKPKLDTKPLGITRQNAAPDVVQAINAANLQLNNLIKDRMGKGSKTFLEALREIEADPASAPLIRAAQGRA